MSSTVKPGGAVGETRGVCSVLAKKGCVADGVRSEVLILVGELSGTKGRFGYLGVGVEYTPHNDGEVAHPVKAIETIRLARKV